jgi:hypothetical protein
MGHLSLAVLPVQIRYYIGGLFFAANDAGRMEGQAMTCAADTKATLPTSQSILAALKRRALRILTPRPVASAMFVRHTEQKRSGDGCKDGMTLESPSLRQNFGTRTTVLWRSRLRKQASNTPAYIIKRREALHLTLDRKDSTCE